ncbi:MAG TPA: hypothetical protein VM118_10490 [Acidobacteriota bacterium]|nr:hypothetical protein [Acidobacteriota bacterium]
MPTWALILLWPLMQTLVDPIILSTRWDPGETIKTGLDNLVAAVVCRTLNAPGGPLIAVDSTGQVAELAFSDGRWEVQRTFSTDVQVTAVCVGATRGRGENWDLFLGTASGRIIALSRTMVGWSSQDVAVLKGPILSLQTTRAVSEMRASLFVIDGDSLITEFVIGFEGKWLSGKLPRIEGGATRVCLHYAKNRLRVSAAGAAGVVYRIDVDSTGIWRPQPWAHLAAGPIDMAPSEDPTSRDIALFYSGTDGIFRYLFYGRTADDISRLPVADATYLLIGAGEMRRINEFFAMSGNEFCLFEFEPGLEEWIEVPIAPIRKPVVSVSFGQGRGERDFQFYVASVDGTVAEFVRSSSELPEEENKE